MVKFISPILGVLEYEVYSIDHILLPVYFKRIKELFKFGIIRSGVLWCETEFDGEPKQFIGLDLNIYLLGKGFSSSESSDLVKIFSVNQSLIDDLVEKGFEVNDVVYGMTLKDRLNALNLTSRIFTKSYAFESSFTIYPVIEVPEEVYFPPPLPPEVVYRSQATFTYSSRKQGTNVELRIWYQSYEPIEEQDLIDKWIEANENAVNITNEPLLDSMEASPGFEHNHEISESEVEGSIDTWYGVLIISRAGKTYKYNVL